MAPAKILGRRALLRALVTGLGVARAQHSALADEPGALDVQMLVVGDANGTGASEHRVLLAVPRANAAPAPLVVLLHGLAETASEELGARAWIDRYGLAGATRRLAGAGAGAGADAARPYAGLSFVCPFMPLLRSGQLAAYASWLARAVVPAARDVGGAKVGTAAPAIAGCSLGARVALDVFLADPDTYRAWAGVQTAISRASAASYASRLARVAKPILVETSTLDPFRDASADLASALQARGARVNFVTLPGPHDQPWLRQSGTPRLLAWLDALGGSP